MSFPRIVNHSAPVVGRLILLVCVTSALSSLGIVLPAISVVPQFPYLLTQSSSDSRRTEADRLFQQGREQFKVGQYQAAIRSWEQALSLYRQLKDRWGEGAVLGNLGIAYSALGNHPKVIEYQEQSLAIVRQVKDRQGESNALLILGTAYRSLGNYAKASESLEQSLAIARELGNRQTEEMILSTLGSLYLNLGDYSKTLRYFEQALALSQALKNRNSEGLNWGRLGIAYFYLKNYSSAIQHQQKSLAIARELKDRSTEANALGNLGIVYLNRADFPQAVDYLQQALVIMQEMGNLPAESVILGHLGNAYRFLGDSSKAIETLQQSIAIARRTQDLQGEGAALNNLGMVLFKTGRVGEAEQALLAAIRLNESLRQGLQDAQKISIGEIQRNPYSNLQEVLIAQNKIEFALEIAERGRARAFVELLIQRTQGKEQMTVSPIQIATIKQIAREQNATLVEYTRIYDQYLFIWVIQPSGEIAFRRVDLAPLLQQKTSLDHLIAAARCLGLSSCEVAVATRGSQPMSFNVAEGDRQFSQLPITPMRNEYLQRLHQLLITPIADLLPSNPNTRVIFLPQGTQFLVPFAALQDSQGQYLIEKHTIAIAPSIQVLQLTYQQRQRRRSTNDRTVLLVGNPAMPLVSPRPGEPAKQLPSLPGAEQEVKAISKLLNVSALVGQQATETVIRNRMPLARIIHLATHGLLDDFGGMGGPGAIALTPSGSDDGLLTVDDLLRLKLQAELVVLSACDTGRGRITGDGVIGLSRALMTAGVPSVIVSLWAVPDAPTAELMTRFYQNLQQGQNKAQALRQAMLDTKKEFPDPRAWSAFTLIGAVE